jgi:primosomal protein N' (replication factor Y)
LVLHKSKNQLTCHHCGYNEKSFDHCKFCQEKNSLTSFGVGVEKIEEEVKKFFQEINFPQARIAVVTSDSIKTFIEAEKLVKEILNNEIDLIIGTQMIAKGYDFPNLTLVGIIDADSMLYSSDLRALEKTYQIFTQVIGRAGRRKEKGRVLIQTFDPKNFIFEKILFSGSKKDLSKGKELFYKFELKNRDNLGLPPFTQYVRFEISAFVEKDAKNFAKKLIGAFPVNDKIEVFGPASAPLQKLKNRHHFLVHLKVQKKVNLQKLVSEIIQSLEIPTSIRVRINIDPN